MKYKVLKDYVSSKGKYQKVGGEVELAEDAVFAQGLLENGFIEGITDGGFEYGDKYCYVDGCGNIFWSIFCEDNSDIFRQGQGNAFRTEEEAEKYLEYLKIKVKMPKTEVKEDDDEELGLPNFVKENIDELAGKLSERGLGELLDMSTKMARSMGEVKTIELILDGVLEEVKHARDEGIHIDVSFMVNALHGTAKRLQKKATKRVAQVMKEVMKDLTDLG